nr:MAG TPA: hypothetical protein [Crassvirales sp.]DAP79132.1 MAG TPA: hypothetical protein [Caudoviricetes sp.]
MNRFNCRDIRFIYIITFIYCLLYKHCSIILYPEFNLMSA